MYFYIIVYTYFNNIIILQLYVYYRKYIVKLLFFYSYRKHTLNCHRMKPSLFSVLCEIKEKTGK